MNEILCVRGCGKVIPFGDSGDGESIPRRFGGPKQIVGGQYGKLQPAAIASFHFRITVQS